jgi:glycosyltransferase involved in cell wall biosynthesis
LKKLIDSVDMTQDKPSLGFGLLVKKGKRRLNRLFLGVRRQLGRAFHRPEIFLEGYTIEDNTQVTLFSENPALFPGYIPRRSLADPMPRQKVRISLVAAARNEKENAARWVECIFQQTRHPDEIIVVDTGSTDGTAELLVELSRHSPVPFNVIIAPGDNIAQGRNRAVLQSRYPVIAVTDFGALARADWLEKLAAPFEIDPRTQVSGGWYDAVGRDGKTIRWRYWLDLIGKDPHSVLSPSVSIAFTKDAWQLVSGYPDWLTLTGEDTYFALELKRCIHYWAFVPEAMVDWEAPDTLTAHWRKIAIWSSGDGETGVNAGVYWHAARSALLFCGTLGLVVLLWGLSFLLGHGALAVAGVILLLALAGAIIFKSWRLGYSGEETVWQTGAILAQTVGYLAGARRRQLVTRRRLQRICGVFFILAGVPIDDTGGGSRFSQIAQELIRRQWAVVYVNRFPRGESVDPNFRICHPNLFCYAASHFSLDTFIQSMNLDLPNLTVGVLVELPHPDWLPLLAGLKQRGARIIYDLLDDWETDLGAGWFSSKVEGEIACLADKLVATAPSLMDHLKQLTGRPVVFLPNAVNLRMFSPDRQFIQPVDYPAGDWSIIYTGSLYGNWFDWDLLVKIARRYPEAAVVIIGDYLGQCPVDLPNLHFLGLKAHQELPAYLACSSVAIIPWKINHITAATNPLKLYEYLAMGKPVVAPDLALLKQIPGVVCATSQEDFVEAVARARQSHLDKELILKYVRDNSWQARVDQLVALLA